MFSRGNDAALMDLCCKKRYIDFQLLTKKVMFFSIFFAQKFGQFGKKQYLCSRFRNERKWATKDCETAWKIVTLKISQLQRKSKIYWKKLLKNLVSPKKSSTFAADFANNENEDEIKQWSLKVWLINDVVQESKQLLNWETENV